MKSGGTFFFANITWAKKSTRELSPSKPFSYLHFTMTHPVIERELQGIPLATMFFWIQKLYIFTPCHSSNWEKKTRYLSWRNFKAFTSRILGWLRHIQFFRGAHPNSQEWIFFSCYFNQALLFGWGHNWRFLFDRFRLAWASNETSHHFPWCLLFFIL